MKTCKMTVVLGLLSFSALSFAQSTAGELLEKGGKKWMKPDFVFPAKVVMNWFNGRGESELTFMPDGTVSGSQYVYSAKSTTPTVGTYTIDEEGKWCVVLENTLWKNKSEGCSYIYSLNGDYYSKLVEGDKLYKLFRSFKPL